MDETYLLAAVKYVEMNPVASGLVIKPEDYAWSSARAHVEGKDDLLVRASPLLEMVGNWASFLGHPKESEMQYLQRHEKTGRPLGVAAFVNHLENQLKRTLYPQKPWPRKKADES